MLDLGTLRIGVQADTDAAKANLRGVQSQAEETSKSAKKSSEEIKQAWNQVNDTFGGIVTAVKVGAAAAGGAFIALAKSSLDGYASFEQNIGGINKLFGTAGQTMDEYAASVGKSTDEVRDKYNSLSRAALQVRNDADNAWRTVGVSANEYMEQVTSFSASLISSLGGDTEKAAAYANTAMVDMADNANVFGTSIEDIQHAYQGFAKQNFTMLDNLKLGYGGTKEEMERLISDANKVKEANGEMANLSIDSFADVVEAIHTMQDSMGIAGTTQREALTTIEGSVNAAKAAWSNWVTELGKDESNMQEVTANLLDSIVAVAENVLPRLKMVFDGIVAEIPNLFSQIKGLLPAEIQGIIDIVTSILPAVAGVVTGIVAVIEGGKIIETVSNIQQGVSALFTVLAANPLLAVVAAIAAVVAAVATLYATNEDFRNYVDANVLPIIQQVIDAFSQFFSYVAPLVQEALAAIQAVFEQVLPYIQGFVEGTLTAIQGIIETALGVIQGVIQVVTSAIKGDWQGVWSGIQQIASSVWSGIQTIVSGGINAVLNIIGGVLTAIQSVWNGAWQAVGNVLGSALVTMRHAVSSGLEAILGFFRNLGGNILGALGNLGSLLWNAGTQIISGLLNGIKAKFQEVQSFVSGIGDWIAAHKGPKAYDLKLLIPNGGWIMQSLATGLRKSIPLIREALNDAASEIAGYDFGSATVEANFNAYKRAREGRDENLSRPLATNSTNITVNNYSPKSLNEKESARQFKNSVRNLALSY